MLAIYIRYSPWLQRTHILVKDRGIDFSIDNAQMAPRRESSDFLRQGKERSREDRA